MRVKVTRGAQPIQLFNYLCSPKKQPAKDRLALTNSEDVSALIFYRSVPGDTTLQLARNFRRIAKLNSRVKKTIAHYSIALPNEDRNRVGTDEMRLISKALLTELGHYRCPSFGIEHHDTAQLHWHLAASTITYSGQWVDDCFERYRLRTIERELETIFGLKQSIIKPVVDVKNLSTGEYRLKKRTHRKLPKEKLWQALDATIPVSQSLARLIVELRVHYPDISIQLKKLNGRHVGISFELDGVSFAGRRLGRAYSLAGLQRFHGIEHRDTSIELVDELLTLSHPECKTLYEDMLRQKLAESTHNVHDF